MPKNSCMMPVRPLTALDRWKTDHRIEARKIAEQVREGFEKQKDEITADYWLRILAMAGLVFYDATGSRSRTEKMLVRLNDKLDETRANGVSTKELVEELSRRTDIELEVRE